MYVEPVIVNCNYYKAKYDFDIKKKYTVRWRMSEVRHYLCKPIHYNIIYYIYYYHIVILCRGTDRKRQMANGVNAYLERL